MQNIKFFFVFSVIFLFFGCKNTNEACNKENEAIKEALLGVWESTLYIQEGGHYSTYPFKPGDNTEWYNYLAFSEDGKVYKAYKLINVIEGKSVLVKEKVFDVYIETDVMTWVDKDKSSKVHFLLKEKELTTIEKDKFNKELIYQYKKVISPTLDEIIKPSK